MKEILITSSVLILAILAIRQIFKGVLSRRFQYALWALVLVRLLVPVSLPAAEFSVMTAARPVEQVVTARLDRIAFTPARPETVQTPETPSGVSPALDHAAADDPLPQIVGPGTVPDLKPAPRMTAGEVMALIWKVGMALMGGFFLVSNLAFYLKLRKKRQEWQASEDIGPFPAHRIYLVPEGVIPSPCLFGRSIYITPAVAEDPARLRHVLTHEATHAKHLDPVWSLLRCVCLTVYWFDPLVWVAAACSKTDCELACDESALKALGETERIGYGQTLLSLIPVKRVGNPMLAATTMTAGKKQLADRITRIARNPRQWVAAALTVALLSGMLAACTFTGAKENPGGLRPLTGKELQWFNLEFFNRNENPAISYTYTIRNQFANPINLYEKPEDIDLHELLYLEGSAPTDEELKRTLDYESWDDLPCPAYKLTTGEIDDILTQYTGLTLDTANRESLTYTYDETTDAWYWMHGDTNYCGELEFLYGTREGDTVKLYHNSGFAGGGWYCVTLEAQEDEGYHFLSNVECQHPAIPAPMPAGDPEATVSLKDLTPYAPPEITLTRAPEGDFDDSYENRLENWSFDGHNVVVYRSALDGRIKAALRREDGTMDVFLDPANLESETISLAPYNDLFGHSGFALGYQVRETNTLEDYRTDFFYLTDEGTPVLLLRSVSVILDGKSQLDMDGDGTDELVTPLALFFQRKGTLYKADLGQLMADVLPEKATFFPISPYDRCYVVQGSGSEAWKRYIYFDGKDLLVYTDKASAATPRPTETASNRANLPDGEPVATISLADTPPYIAPGDGVEASPGNAPDREEYLLARYPIGEDGILLYRDPQDDQIVYAALARSDGSLEVFLTTRDPNTQALPIDRLFDQGKEAHLLALGYWESEGQPRWPTWDFYAFWDGRPVLLCRSTGCGGVMPQILDLDGDGTVELITQEELFFLLNGTLRRAELKELLLAACPELDSCDLVASEDGSCFRVCGYTETFKTATRSVYFDGENLLVYKDEKPTEDHMVAGADEGVPALVVEKARDYAKTVYEGKIEKTSDPVPTDGGTSYLWGDPASYDDWRVKSFHGPYTFDIAGVNIIAWGFNHELHTTTPENVVLAGGMYITEDDWVCTGYSNTDYVFCIQNDQGDLTFGWYDWYQEGMESYYVHNSVLHAMQEHGVIPNDGSTYAGLQFKSDLDYLLDHSGNQLRVQYDDNQGGGGTYLVNPAEGNGSFYRNQLTDPSNYIWGSFGEGEDWYAPDCPSVTLSQPDWNMFIQFWLYDNIVMVKYSNREPIWYGAQSTFDPMDPFYLRSTAYYQARCWFDDAQYEALAAELPLIPDSGQSYLNIAQTWVEGHEGIKARLSPGGSSTCSFVKVTGVGTLEDISERWFPADILDYPHFAFTYDVAFVPENEDALITLMAGNTGNYEGGDPTVPQGAYTYSRMGSMYLKDGFWYCAGVGTG